MLIDWFTVIAQIINFLILVFLLHRFLYKPMLKVIDKRQAQLNDQWQSAQEEQEKAEAEAEAHRQAQRDLDNRRDQLMAEAHEAAEKTRKEELHRVRQEIDQKRQEWYGALEEEQQSVLADLQERIGHQVVAIARRTLQDLANRDLEAQTIQAFEQRLRELDEETRQEMAEAFSQYDQPVKVQTSLDLPESSRESLRQTLQEMHLINGQPIDFDRSSDLIFGIRLQNAAYDVSWSADEYLRDLERMVKQHLPTAVASGKEEGGNGDLEHRSDSSQQSGGEPQNH